MQNRVWRSIAAGMCCVLLCVAAGALDPDRQISQYGHTAWRIQDGVFSDVPVVITQTTDGYLWIGTPTGLMRFDGVHFISWVPSDGKQLPRNDIHSLLGARDGSLWIGTGRGLARWKNNQLTDYPGTSDWVNSILEDRDGTIWIARSQVRTQPGPLCRVAGNQVQCYGEAEGVPFPSAVRILQDNSGYLWVGGPFGLSRWKSGSSKTYFQEEFKRNGGLMGVVALTGQPDGTLWASIQRAGGGFELRQLVQGSWTGYALPGIIGSDAGVSALFTDRDNTVWVGTASRGIYRIHGGKADHFGSADGLSSDAVANFFQDREGTLWVATSKGVDSFRDTRVVSFSMTEGLTADSVSTVLGARDGTVWIGNSGALDSLKNGKLSAIRTRHGLPGRDITTLFEDHGDRLWFGVDSGLWVYDRTKFRSITKSDGTPLGIIFGIAEDTEQNIWVRGGPNLYRIQDFKVQEAISNPQVSTAFKIAADPRGGIWLGLTDGNLVRYVRGETPVSPKPAPDATQVRAILPESDSSAWAATQSGLVYWKDGRSKTLTSQDGLPCNELYTLVKDNLGFYWLYTKCGLVAIAGSELRKWLEHPGTVVQSRVFDVFDGVQPGLAPLQPTASRSSDGLLWFANDSVLQMMDPRHLDVNPIPPPVHIERVIADRKNYLLGEDLRLPALTRDIEIDYAGLSFVVPQKVRFRYKLEGHDADWQEPQTRRQAFYSDLRPGSYRFHVIACNNDGIWNEVGASLDFTLRPAFYQTNWFLFLCVGAAACLAWVAYQLRVRQLAEHLDSRFEERLAERTLVAQDLHDTLLQGFLSASMQLHVADSHLPVDSPAKPIVGRVLELMGQVINEGRNAVRGLRSPGSELDNLEQVFSRIPQELAIAEPIDFRLIVEGQARPLHPVIRDEVYRIGREALVNAFRHSQATGIEVELEYADSQLRVLIRDNGRGIDPQVLRAGREGHWGLSGMRERAERIGAKLKVWSRAAGGTEVELSVPGQIAFRHNPAGGASRWLTRLRPRTRESRTSK
ncbi:MAG TPA: two-component regulator propeller domain-containing protein [Terriglobales bacterium]|nr:two-component regulator propeller domain-containing protein [Terriglobales bacterium]